MVQMIAYNVKHRDIFRYRQYKIKTVFRATIHVVPVKISLQTDAKVAFQHTLNMNKTMIYIATMSAPFQLSKTQKTWFA